MQQQVGGQLRCGDRDLSGELGVEFEIRERVRCAARFPDLAAIVDHEALLGAIFTEFHGCFHRTSSTDPYFHRMIVTRVPPPTLVSMSNSFTRRFAPVSPMPRPVPEVHPSVIASARSAIPGPSSANRSFRPRRVSVCNSCQRMTPPRP